MSEASDNQGYLGQTGGMGRLQAFGSLIMGFTDRGHPPRTWSFHVFSFKMKKFDDFGVPDLDTHVLSCEACKSWLEIDRKKLAKEKVQRSEDLYCKLHVVGTIEETEHEAL